MRVGILGLLHESNTFLCTPTRWNDFVAGTLASGEEVRATFADAPHEIGGFFAGLEQSSIEAVPLFAARDFPFGTIAADTFLRLVNTMLDQLNDAGQLDGILVAPHGATVSEHYPDADGHWLSKVREFAGPSVPIIGTLDPHANLSPAMVNACDALAAYRTNPHMDQRSRGMEAANLMAHTLKKTVRPTMAAEFPPMAISIECQCTEEVPCHTLFQSADEMLSDSRVLTNSILLGFPYADVVEMGSAVTVVTNDDTRLAQRRSQELAVQMWNARKQFVGDLLDVKTAVEQTLQAEAPVCLLDMGDNVGGGSGADGTWIGQELLRRRVNRSVIAMFDPTAVQKAREAGIGTSVRLQVGGHSEEINGQPIDTEFTVTGLYDGQFTESQSRHGGYNSFDQGPTAVLACVEGLTIIATSRRMVPFSLGQLTSCQLDPASFRVLVAKGVNAPLAAYGEVCRTFIRVNTPGHTCADMTQLEFQHRRRPMFPFEQNAHWAFSE